MSFNILNEDLCFLVLQLLNIGKFEETARLFEQKSRVFFNINHFKELVINGPIDECYKYILAFIPYDNLYSVKIFTELKKLEDLEALNKNKHELSDYTNARQLVFNEVQQLIESHPLLREKLQFPDEKKRSFRRILNHLLNYNMIAEPTQVQSMMLPTDAATDKIEKLSFTNSGTGIIGLASNATHLFWKWSRNDINRSGTATIKDAPHLFQPQSGVQMINDQTNTNAGEGLPCLALTKNDFYLLSSSGGKVSLYQLSSLKMAFTCMDPPPTVTCLAIDPEDDNRIFVGAEDSSIHVFNLIDQEKIKLQGHGHLKRVTGLAFSPKLNILVSAGADDKIITWSGRTWKRKKGEFLHIPANWTPTSSSGTRVQFHTDKRHFLVVHETQLSIYESRKLKCVKQRIISEPNSALITHATFSCHGYLIYASFMDGSIGIFAAANIQLLCMIDPAAYLPSDISSKTWPIVLAAHPDKPNMFGAGLSNGKVYIFEPLDAERRWGINPECSPMNSFEDFYNASNIFTPMKDDSDSD